MLNHDRSRSVFSEAKTLIPGGVNSPARAFGAVGGDPIVMDQGEGAYLIDVDGNRYLDYVQSWGPMILGHAHPVVVKAVQAAVLKGTSFGTPTVVENELAIRIIEAVEGAIGSWQEAHEVGSGTIGEIVVRGPVVTRSYAGNAQETRLAKIPDGEGFWHRMGDMGYLDPQGRLWFCGRKAHRVPTAQAMLYTIPCEAIFNEHPQVRRSALIGLGNHPDRKTPVIVVEPAGRIRDQQRLFAELRDLAKANPLTEQIEHFLLHHAFPVDIRHNAKIFRERLAAWAAKRVQLPCA
jgi:acyl-CoA synthetase (AMP-forming)/AMP-acid ligase II